MKDLLTKISVLKIGLASSIYLYSSIIFSAPGISSISGTISHGSTITITGTRFSTNTSPTPLIWDDFELGNTGSIINSSPRIGSWLADNRPDPRYSETRSFSGKKSLHIAYNTSQQWSSFVANPLPLSDYFYQSFKFWFSSPGSGQIKLVQVHGNSGVGDFAPGIMIGSSGATWWMAYISTESGANDLETRVSFTTIPEPATWHQYEMWLKRSSSGGAADGTIIVKIDGITRFNKVNAVTRENSLYNWEEISFVHGLTNMGQSTDVYIDDAYLNNSWARVELCDSPTYSACTIKVVQPTSSWKNDSITATLNKGPFNNINTLYLYVIDNANVANSNGYPFCENCPRSPAALTAK